jgi:ribulose-phosphate 3-epimerase
MNLADDIGRLEAAGGRICHFDVMDGHFCPMLTVGSWFVAAVKTTMLKDVHLMVDNPVDVVEEFVDAGADLITVHLEAGRGVHRALELISGSERDGRAPLSGLAINPGTPVIAVEPFLDVVDVILVLGINPGWRQPLLPSTLEKVRAAQALAGSAGRDVLVAVDGGITLENFATVAKLQPDIVVSGSAVFKGGQVEANLQEFSAHRERALATV